MKRINLQMFAIDPNSIVDYLKSTGQDSSYSARKELAASLGISNYSGTAEQNTQMLNSMKNKNTSPSVSSGGDSKKNTSSGTNGPSPSSSGPSQSPSNRGGIVSQDVWDIIDTSFSPSTAYKDAMNYTNELLQQLSSGRTSFTDQIKDMLNEIQNRDKFSYDLSNDTLFQQSLASAMASGKTAMQDTMGQASALTGGYGSTYATSAANQQYNAFIEDAYNNLPEYYEMALQAYEMEGNEMYKQLAALSDADATEYERLYNSWSANAQTAQQMYQNEYTAWADSVSNAMGLAGLQMDEFSTMFDADFSYAQLAQDQKQYESDLAYRYAALAQDQRQFDTKMAQDQAQFDKTLASKQNSSTGPGGSNGKNNLPSETQMKNALKYYEEGGDAGLEKYLASLGKDPEADEAFLTELIDYAHGYGTYTEPEIELEKRTFTKTKNTFNWLWGDDNNDVVVDQYGNEYRIDELPERLRGELTKLKEGESYTAK